jgi:hypothetical protein
MEVDAYKQWMSNYSPFVKERVVSDIKITARYMPADYLAYKDLKAVNSLVTQQDMDSLSAKFSKGLYFLISLEPTDATKGKLVRRGITTHEEYNRRVQVLSFNMDAFISLEYGQDNTLSPSLVNYEGLHELGDRINFMVVFPESHKVFPDGGKLRLVFEDPFWQTGTNRFSFEVSQITNIPKLISKL